MKSSHGIFGWARSRHQQGQCLSGLALGAPSRATVGLIEFLRRAVRCRRIKSSSRPPTIIIVIRSWKNVLEGSWKGRARWLRGYYGPSSKRPKLAQFAREETKPAQVTTSGNYQRVARRPLPGRHVLPHGAQHLKQRGVRQASIRPVTRGLVRQVAGRRGSRVCFSMQQG